LFLALDFLGKESIDWMTLVLSCGMSQQTLTGTKYILSWITHLPVYSIPSWDRGGSRQKERWKPEPQSPLPEWCALFLQHQLFACVRAIVVEVHPSDLSAKRGLSVLFSPHSDLTHGRPADSLFPSARALDFGYLTQDMIDDYEPALMFTIPRLAIVW
jgi:hypothetical protein